MAGLAPPALDGDAASGSLMAVRATTVGAGALGASGPAGESEMIHGMMRWTFTVVFGFGSCALTKAKLDAVAGSQAAR